MGSIASTGKASAPIRVFRLQTGANRGYTSALHHAPLPKAVRRHSADALDRVRVG